MAGKNCKTLPVCIDMDTAAKQVMLRLSHKERSLMQQELEKMINYAGILNEVDTQDAEPTVHALPQSNVFRNVENEEPLARDELLFNAPRQDGGMFLVKRVVE